MSKGGHNQTHECTARFGRLDSFTYRSFIALMDSKDRDFMRSRESTFYRDRIEASGEVIRTETVPNNYGGAPRLYFLCPRCGCRVRFLYYRWKRHLCRSCARLNYRSQQATKGTDTAYLKMRRIVGRLKGDASLSPCDLESYYPQRPKGMHEKTYNRLLVELRRAQIEYYNAFMSEAARIMGGAKWI